MKRSIRFGGAYNNKKLQTEPVEPETSTSENPMNAHRTKLFDKEGLRQIEIIGNEDYGQNRERVRDEQRKIRERKVGIIRRLIKFDRAKAESDRII